MEAMNSHRSTLSPSNIEKTTSISRVPKPFSIESLIAHQSPQHHINDLSINRQQLNDVSDVPMINHPAANGYAGQHFSIPPFPLYNPWMGYLTQTATERLSQFFSRNEDKLTHFLDSDSSSRDSRFVINPLDVTIQREKLAQYFVNNIRDPNKGKLSEFLISATTGSDYNGLLISDSNQCISEKQFFVNQSSVTQNSDDNNFVECNRDDKDIGLESDDSCCDLSLTLSPNGKNQGSKALLQILLVLNFLTCLVYCLCYFV